jgi:hypothetical protein
MRKHVLHRPSAVQLQMLGPARRLLALCTSRSNDSMKPSERQLRT